ncbi:MAG: class I adenylate-forming enzyme family protein [Pseudomonadales bacterium]
MNVSYTRDEIIAEDEVLLGCAEDEIVDQLPARLSHGILKWAIQTPDAVAVVASGKTLDYKGLAHAVAEAGQFLQSQGVRPGDRVMMVSENGMALMVLVLALSEMDAVAAVINARLSEREINLIEADCEPRLVIYTIDDSTDATELADTRSAVRHELAVGNIAVSTIKDVPTELAGLSSADQILAMIYTTGTTGAPKGVMLTHRNLAFIAFVSGRLRGIRAGDPVYGVLPMSHVFGLSAVSCSVLFSGGAIHLVARFAANEALRALVEDGIVGFLGVPTMYARMLEALASQPEWRSTTLRFLYSGGAPLAADLKSRIEARFGMPLHNGYGLTESGPTISQTRLYAPMPNCSVGFVLPGVETRILDAAGNEVEPGAVGELWARGPNIMKGYFRKPEMTAQVLQDGWFNTGDLVFMDESGAINISGRTKELIIRSGFNVYPPEVESVLSAHPLVSVAAVVGRQVDGDEEIVAFVQPVAGHVIDIAGLLAFAREKLAGYKVPGKIIVMAELPAAPSGKILKHQLEV